MSHVEDLQYLFVEHCDDTIYIFNVNLNSVTANNWLPAIITLRNTTKLTLGVVGCASGGFALGSGKLNLKAIAKSPFQ